jgi:ferredoxin hydrogenase large subunit/hydrogenase large subunit
MAKKIVLDPITRIEGHLRIDTKVENNRVVEAWSKGEMFRGFEAILAGRDPLDAPVITQRICGVCPVSHAVASVKNIESAIGLVPTRNGILLRNLILAANYLQSHILHFYQLSALDFINVEDILEYNGKDTVLHELRNWVKQEIASNKILPAAPFLPKLSGPYPVGNKWNATALSHYLEALEVRQQAHKMAALIGGKIPHVATLVPGGVTCSIEPELIENFRMRLRKVQRFITDVYLPDVITAAKLFPKYANMGSGLRRYLSFGVFDEGDSTWITAGTVEGGVYQKLDTAKISEVVHSSKYVDTEPLHPAEAILFHRPIKPVPIPGSKLQDMMDSLWKSALLPGCWYLTMPGIPRCVKRWTVCSVSRD